MLPRPGRLLQMLMRGAEALPLPEGATAIRDIAYGPAPAQCLDLYRPGNPAGPIMLIVHGGAWSIGDKARPDVVAHKLAHWLPLGYVVASTNYRLLPAADPITQARDVARAIALLQLRAEEWGADARRLIVLGHSTGAHLAALLTADADLAASGGAAPWLATVLLDSAALDVVETLRGPHMPLHERAFGPNPAYWEQASPLHRLREKAVPMLLVHAAARRDSGEQARRFAAAALALGGRAEVLPVALSHAEINAQLGADAAYTASVDAFLSSLELP